jgi:hypothetical protein
VDYSTTPASTEFDLDVTIVATGVPAMGFDSADCTSDGCGGTGDSAGTTC